LTINGLHIIGPPHQAKSVLSVSIDEIHPHDIATFLDEANIAIRAGHHCAQPLLDVLGLPATSRISFSIYNQPAEIDMLVASLKEIKRFFS
jgi:cysteine desulfurase/selenocysteine lyase